MRFDFHARKTSRTRREYYTQCVQSPVPPSRSREKYANLAHLFAEQRDVVAFRNLRRNAVLAEQSPRDDVQIVLAIVALARRKERAVQVAAIVVDGAAAAVASRQRHAGTAQLRHVRLAERILVATDDDARIVGPQHQHVMGAQIVVLVDPVLQCQIGENVVRLRDEHRLLNGRCGGIRTAGVRWRRGGQLPAGKGGDLRVRRGTLKKEHVENWFDVCTLTLAMLAAWPRQNRLTDIILIVFEFV